MLWGLIFILGAILLGAILWWLFSGARLLKSVRKKGLSTIVFGNKGKGKSLLFSYMAQHEKEGYLSNVRFDDRAIPVEVKEISVSPNDWEKALEGDFVTIPKNDQWEGKPVYLDDCAVYLPNFADNVLKKSYGSLPLAYAVWRHLYDAPIHLNCQTLGRTWKLLREQADVYIKCRGVLKLPFFCVVKFTYYDNYQSAEQSLLPMASRWLNSVNKGHKDQFTATHGTIKNAFVLVRKKKIEYDTRYFRQRFFPQGSDSGVLKNRGVGTLPTEEDYKKQDNTRA